MSPMSATVYIPRDSSALSMGAGAVADAISAEAKRRNADVRIVRNGSRGLYWLEPLVEVETPKGRVAYGPVSASDVASLFDANFLAGEKHRLALGITEEIPYLKSQERLTFARVGITDPVSLDDYVAHGGYRGLQRALSMTGAQVVEEVTVSGLRGRGGAGFPAGIKWKTTLGLEAKQKYVVCNADEGDSGTFSDRMIMEGDPFVLIEGMTIAAVTVGATQGYIYLRSEYPHALRTLNEAIATANARGYLGANVLDSGKAFKLEVRVGAGAYICGEETAMLESLEGKRGMVRYKPPVPAIVGLFGMPTIINNVITLASVPIVVEKGGNFYKDYGMGRSRGTLPIQLAGNAKRPGLIEKAFGVTLREIIYEYGGGTASGRPVRAVQVGGPLGAYFSRLDARPADGLRGDCREGRSRRPWRNRGLRRHGRPRADGALRDGVLRDRVVRQMHAVPDRIDARCRSNRPHHPQRGSRCECGVTARPVRYDAERVTVRARRSDAAAGAERAHPFSRRFRPCNFVASPGKLELTIPNGVEPC